MHREEYLWEMTSLIMYINPAEIKYQIENDNLKQWCIRWQNAAKMALVQAPLSDDSPLPEGCAKCKLNWDSMCMLMPLDGYDEGNGSERRENCPLEKRRESVACFTKDGNTYKAKVTGARVIVLDSGTDKNTNNNSKEK